MSVQANEVQSLASTPVTKAPENGIGGNLKTFGDMSLDSQHSMLGDLVSWRKIKPRDFLITSPSLQDGHEGIDTQCNEYTFSRSAPKSRIHCKNQEGRRLGQSLK